MAMRQTWMDNSADAADLDLLTAPIVPVGGSGGKKGKRSRDDGGAPPAPVAKESASAKEEDGGVMRFDDEGKLVVLDGNSKAAKQEKDTERMEVDPEDDEIIRPDSGGGKRRKVASGTTVVPASKAEEAEAEQLEKAKRQQKRLGRNVDERNKRRLGASKFGSKANTDHFGANFGEAYKGKKGAQGDVTRNGGSGVQPYAYLPLNPRMLGKKQQKKATETMTKLLGPSASKSKKGKMGAEGGKGIGKKKVSVGKHGIQKRREKNARRNSKGK